MSGNRVHQGWRQAIVWLQPEFLEARSNARHLRRINAGLDHRGHERRKLRSGRSRLREELSVDEVQSVERMSLVLDTSVHMRPAGLAGVPLDRRRGIDNLQLVAVFENGDVFAR